MKITNICDKITLYVNIIGEGILLTDSKIDWPFSRYYTI